MSALDMWHLIVAARRRKKEQWYSAARLRQLREHRLQRLARLAYQAPYYRQIFQRARIAPEQLTESSLEQLPVLEKNSLRTARRDLLPDPSATMFPINTSGST